MAEQDTINLGKISLPLIKGDQGNQGIAGKIIALQVYMLETTDQPTITNYGNVQNAKIRLGIPKAVGIDNLWISQDGHLHMDLSNNSTYDLGNVVGSSVSSVYIDENYNLMVELTDETEINAGNLEQEITDIINEFLQNYYTKTESDNKFSLITETGKTIELSINPTTYVMTLNLKNKNGTTISTDNIDLPLETMVVSASYDNTNKKIVLTLKNGSTIDVPVGDLISGLQTEITSSNKLSADLVDDTNRTHKFVTAEQKEIIDSVQTDYAHTLTLGYRQATQELEIGIADYNGTVLDEGIADLSDLARKSYVDDETDKLYEELQEKQEEIDTLHSWLDQTTDTAEGEGTEITLENTLELPMKSIIGEGNSEQESTEGTNLCPPLVKGVKIDATKGAQTNDQNYATSDYIPVDFNTNSNYYLSGLTNKINSFVFAYNANKEGLGRTNGITRETIDLVSSSFISGTPQGTGDIAYIRITQYYSVGNTGTIDDVDNLKIMLNIGETALPYEPYTGGNPAPNPDYPFPIKNVTGENSVVVHTENRFDINSIELAGQQATLIDMDITDNVVTFTAKSTIGAQLGTAYVYNLDKTKNYRFSFKGKKKVAGTDGGPNIRIVVQGSNDNTNWTQVANLNQASPVQNQEYSFAQIITGYTTYRVYLYNNTSTPVTIGEQTQYYDIMLVEGTTTPSEYIPYGNQTKPLNLGNIELNKIGFDDLIFKNTPNSEYYDNTLVENAWYVKNGAYHYSGKLRYDSDSFNTNYNRINAFLPLTYGAKGHVTQVLCNKLKAKPNSSVNARQPNATCIIRPEIASRQSCWVWLDDITTKAQAETFLNNTDFELIYELATPIDTQITDSTLISQLEEIDKMQSYSGTTIITSTYEEGNAQMILKAVAYANKVTDTRLNNIEARLALLEE